MLGFLARHEGNRQRLLAALPGSSPLVRLDALIDNIREFIGVFEDARRKMDQLSARPLVDDEGDTQLEEGRATEAADEAVVPMPLINPLQAGQRDHETVNAVITMLEEIRSSL